MDNEGTKADQVTLHKQQPHRVHLPGFISDKEVGLGDVFKRATLTLGIQPCGDCEKRAALLNRWLVFKRQHTK